jgi:hypothetical protein
MKAFVTLVTATAVLALAACNGTSSSSPFFPSNSSYVRIAHGSPDAGTVAVQIDGTAVQSALTYGTMSSYASLKTGAHTLKVLRSGSGKTLTSATFSTNAGQDTTVVITGERHPTYASKSNLGVRVFTEQPFNTPSGGAAVNYHNAAPAMQGALNLLRVPFGYSLDSAPGNNHLGTSQSFGGATNPQGLPSSALNTPITLFAKNFKAFTITPGDAMSGCTGMPCNGQGNLSLYLVDGRGASRTPTSNYPPYFGRHSKADFIGTFDGNGLIQ